MFYNFAILVILASFYPSTDTKPLDVTFSCRTYGQINYVFLQFSSFNYTFEQFRELLDYYGNGLMLACDNDSTAIITSYLVPVFDGGDGCRCSGNLTEHRKCVLEFANDETNYNNSIYMTGGDYRRHRDYDNWNSGTGGMMPATTVNWPVILTRASDRLHSDSTQMYTHLAMERLMLLTDLSSNGDFDEGLSMWMRTESNALGAFPLNDDLSYMVIIYDGKTSEYHFPLLAGPNQVHLVIHVIQAHNKTGAMLNADGVVQFFCKPAPMWTSSIAEEAESDYSIAVFVSLSNTTTEEEETVVHQYITNLQSQLPGDMCPGPAVMNQLSANRSMPDYFKVIVYKPEIHAISCPLLQSNFTVPYCSNCLAENLIKKDRLHSLRSTTVVHQFDCLLGIGIINEFVQLLMENKKKQITVLYITNLIPSCITLNLLDLTTSESRRVDFDIWFLNTSVSTVANPELALFNETFHLQRNVNNSVRFTYIPDPILNLADPHWISQTGICQRNVSSASLKATTPYVPLKATAPYDHSHSDKDKPMTWVYYLIGGLFLMIFFTVVCLFRFYQLRKYKRHMEQMAALEQHKHLDHNGVSNMYCKLKQSGRIDSNRLQIIYDQQLGHGAFASVYRGKLYDHMPNGNEKPVSTEVAVKLPTAKQLVEVGQIEHELEILSQISHHPNIITLHGFIEDMDTFGLILELAADNLLQFAKSTTVENFSIRFTFTVARQIASAMQHLVAANLVHRDLAARNILLTASRVAKLSDFGLCCRSNDDSLYYMAMSNRRLPVKWMALEIFSESGQRFSEKSDIWSFGVLLYEVFSLGKTPYDNLPNEELREFLMDGKRLDRPELTPEKIYELMLYCWNADPQGRPTFSELYNTFDGLLNDQLEKYDYMTVGNAYITLN